MSYQSVIDSFDVVNNPKYQPTAYATYCNIFAQDVMDKMGEPLPTGGCTAMHAALMYNAFVPWESVTASEAQDRANAGYGTIGITDDHVVVIYPEDNYTASDVYGLYMSMAGYACFNNKSITYAWTHDDLPSVRFYSYFG